MEDPRKVIEALEICTSIERDCSKCPYQEHTLCHEDILDYCLELLKAYEHIEDMLDYQRAVEECLHNAHYEPSFNPDDGSM